eukprot:COSAG04_NODE_541_length_12866_cov_847.972351_6_plen_124_part_00
MDNRGLRARLESQADGSATEAERLAEVQQENSELMAAVSRKRLFGLRTLRICPSEDFAKTTTTVLHPNCLRRDWNSLMETLLINVCFCRQVMEARAATTQAETLAASEKATADTLREERVRHI